MKGMNLALAALAGLCLTACGAERADEAAAEAAPPAEAPADAPRPAATPAQGRPAAPRAPAFAVLPADGRAETPALTADGPGGPGGMVTYLTQLTPEAVVDFHRGHAEAAGLATVMTMTQGDARAYGAASQQPNGGELQVVASPVAVPQGPSETSVTLTWTAGG